MCGCYYCYKIYISQQVQDYVNSGTCVLCPKCGIDSVLPDATLTLCQITVELLKHIRE